MIGRTTNSERVSVAGYGAIGRELVQHLAKGIPGLRLTSVATRRPAEVKERLQKDGIEANVVALTDLPRVCDLAIECESPELLPAIAEPILQAGKQIVVLSAGALLDHPYLIALAEEHSGRIIIPTGALAGLDAVGAAAQSRVRSVRIVSKKPLRALAGAPYLEDAGVVPESVTEPVRVFSGTARQAARGFPSNLNVTAALALAGIGPDRTEAEVWIDPGLATNNHTITVDCEEAHLTMSICNTPTENPRTGRITASSVISLLKKRHAAVVVGS